MALRIILVSLHIISAGIWIAQFPAWLAFVRITANANNKVLELPLLMTRGRIGSFLGEVGSVGILISGLALSISGGWGVFNIGGFTPTWLLVKQVIFVIAMLIVFLFIVPGWRRSLNIMIEAAKGTPTVTPAIRAMNDRLDLISHGVNVLVVVNIIVGVWKPS